MAPWEIWTADVHGDHPVVIISNPQRVAHKADVVVLQCVTLRTARLKQLRGEVSRERRREIARKVIQGLAFAGL